ncbi:MAG TPA: ABC transporter substrate-binding protein [Methylomirabilota bacterium]|nr:ABC transporter substrate-binding protein [Methylomirabilota bacterium]
MTRTRVVLVFPLIVAILAAPLHAEAQTAQKVFRVGLISTTTPVATIMSDPTHPFNSGFRREMRDRGYVEGQNFILELRSLEGRMEQASEVVAELVRLNVDVIMTVTAEMTRAAKQVTTTVPIVMAPVRAPVEAGLVASLARPGGNITGLTLDTGGEQSKRLELLKEGLPQLRRVAYLGAKAEWEGPEGISIRASARALGLALFLAEFRPNDYAEAFGLIARERPHAIITSTNPHHYNYRGLITEFAASNRVPSMSYSRWFVEAGGLMSYGVDVRDLYRRAATYVDRILKGAKPADLPVEQPTKFELVISMKTAKALGLTIPPSVLMQADHLIR